MKVVFIQCTRCKGIFPADYMTECYAAIDPDKWLADLCPQCLEGWEHFNAFVGDNE